MSILDANDGTHYVASILRLAARGGVDIQTGTDFSQYREIIRTQRTGQPPAPLFDPDVIDSKRNPGVWFTGTDRDGQLVFTQAMRRMDIGNLSLADYLKQRFVDFYPAGMSIDLNRSRYQPGPGAQRVRGEVYYHGDLWTLAGAPSMRGTGLPNVLARLAMVTLLMRTTPDYLFGFIAQKLAFKGLGDREGYMHHDPASLLLCNATSGDMIPCQLVWMGSEDLRYLLNVAPEGVLAA